jgi:Ca2+/H+ antiporter
MPGYDEKGNHKKALLYLAIYLLAFLLPSGINKHESYGNYIKAKLPHFLLFTLMVCAMLFVLFSIIIFFKKQKLKKANSENITPEIIKMDANQVTGKNKNLLGRNISDLFLSIILVAMVLISYLLIKYLK